MPCFKRPESQEAGRLANCTSQEEKGSRIFPYNTALFPRTKREEKARRKRDTMPPKVWWNRRGEFNNLSDVSSFSYLCPWGDSSSSWVHPWHKLDSGQAEWWNGLDSMVRLAKSMVELAGQRRRKWFSHWWFILPSPLMTCPALKLCHWFDIYSIGKFKLWRPTKRSSVPGSTEQSSVRTHSRALAQYLSRSCPVIQGRLRSMVRPTLVKITHQDLFNNWLSRLRQEVEYTITLKSTSQKRFTCNQLLLLLRLLYLKYLFCAKSYSNISACILCWHTHIHSAICCRLLATLMEFLRQSLQYWSDTQLLWQLWLNPKYQKNCFNQIVI